MQYSKTSSSVTVISCETSASLRVPMLVFSTAAACLPKRYQSLPEPSFASAPMHFLPHIWFISDDQYTYDETCSNNIPLLTLSQVSYSFLTMVV